MRVLLSATLLLSACAGAAAPGPAVGPSPAPSPTAIPPPPPSAPTVPPGVHLPSTFAVTRYAPRLTIDPAQPTFTGAIEIVGTLAAPTDVIWLHAVDLTIARATATTAAGGVPLTALAGLAPGRVALRSAAPLPAGPVTLTLDYRGRLDEVDTAGAFRQRVADDWYVFTHHEPLDARRTFPCVDEPSAKVPWQLTLEVPAAMTAVANAPVATERVDGATRRIAFAATPPLPSYLIAFAVGRFDVVPAGTSSTGAPLRILTPAGQAAEAGFAAEATPKLLAAAERWFGTPYPYAKLDSIAVPITVGFGAMENPGLITYRAPLILMPADAPASRRRAYAAVASHELAHQWFGNLVTPVWWDDLWLNESFASWLPGKLLAEVYPAWTSPTDAADARGGALLADGLATARAIRQPIVTEGDIESAFDGITYGKGAAVLRMFEAHLGPEGFQRGVRAYLAAHAHGNATAADFLAALDAAAPGRAVAAALATFLDQAGAPRVTATVACGPGGAAVELTQTRDLPLGAAPAAGAPTWRLPVCLLVEAGRAPSRTCVELTGPSLVVPLARCPRWVWPNADGLGYYRAAVAPPAWAAILEGRGLQRPARVALADDLVAAVDAGTVELDAALAAVPALAAGAWPEPASAVDLVRRAEPWVPAAARPRFQRAVRRWFAAGRKLGLATARGESIEDERRRGLLIPLLADLGEDPALRRAAVAQATRWRDLPSGDRTRILAIAVRVEPGLHDQLLAAFRSAPDREVRGDLAPALGLVADPARLQAALALVLDPAIDIRDARPILWAATSRDDTRPIAEAFVRANADALLARMPPQWRAGLIGWLTSGCDASGLAELRAFAEAKLVDQPGGRRTVDQSLERLAQCAARGARFAPAIAAWAARLR